MRRFLQVNHGLSFDEVPAGPKARQNLFDDAGTGSAVAAQRAKMMSSTNPFDNTPLPTTNNKNAPPASGSASFSQIANKNKASSISFGGCEVSFLSAKEFVKNELNFTLFVAYSKRKCRTSTKSTARWHQLCVYSSGRCQRAESWAQWRDRCLQYRSGHNWNGEAGKSRFVALLAKN